MQQLKNPPIQVKHKQQSTLYMQQVLVHDSAAAKALLASDCCVYMQTMHT
jgi:hypothetical protein